MVNNEVPLSDIEGGRGVADNEKVETFSETLVWFDQCLGAQVVVNPTVPQVQPPCFRLVRVCLAG
jgi:hypothetical protein